MLIPKPPRGSPTPISLDLSATRLILADGHLAQLVALIVALCLTEVEIVIKGLSLNIISIWRVRKVEQTFFQSARQHPS